MIVSPVARETAASVVAHHTSRESKGYAGVGRPGTCSRGRRPVENRTQRAAHYARVQALAQVTHRARLNTATGASSAQVWNDLGQQMGVLQRAVQATITGNAQALQHIHAVHAGASDSLQP